MNANTEVNPYSVPVSAHAAWVTSKGFSVEQCRSYFFASGVLAGAVGGLALYFAGETGGDLLQQLAVPGLAFGLALWLSIQCCIGSVSWGKKLLLILGCLLAFAVCGIVYAQSLPWGGGWGVVQPISWRTLKPCLFGPAAGAAVLTVVLSVTSRRLTLRMLFSGWVVLSVAGTILMFLSDEFGMRRRFISESLSACICAGVFVAFAMGVVGWQLAAANSKPVDAAPGEANEEESHE